MLHTSFCPFFDCKLGRTEAVATERSTVLVISPLVSLMVEQVSSFQAHRVSAAILSENVSIKKYYSLLKSMLTRATSGYYLLLLKLSMVIAN